MSEVIYRVRETYKGTYSFESDSYNSDKHEAWNLYSKKVGVYVGYLGASVTKRELTHVCVEGIKPALSEDEEDEAFTCVISFKKLLMIVKDDDDSD